MSEELELPLYEQEPEVAEPTEGMDDLRGVDAGTVSQAVVSATDWTTETIVSQINKGNIQLNPKFQRRDAWDAKRKSRFIESLILGLPVPQLVLAESRDRKGAYIVIDGKQRLLSIRQFAADPGDSSYERLKLSGLAIRPDLVKKSLTDLRSDVSLFSDLAAFENQPIRTVVIKNWPNEDFLYHVFLRLNTGSVPLSPQELRQALHPGPFVDYADTRSSESDALRSVLNLRKPDFRMRDVELFVRYYGFQFFLSDYNGELKDFLDLTCKRLNRDWQKREEEIRATAERLEAAYQTAKLVFGARGVFRKWTGQNYERPLNRAIFDTVMYNLSDRSACAVISDRRKDVEDVFKTLCTDDKDFLGECPTNCVTGSVAVG